MNQKKIGLWSGVAICMGLIVATSCLVSLGQGFGLAGNMFILPLAIVVVLNSFIGISFSELYQLMPNATGGLGQYTLAGLGPWASIVSNLSAYVITMLFGTSVELAMCGIMLNGLFPSIPANVFSLGVLILLFILNLFGVDIFSKVQNITVILLIGSMALLGAIAVLGLAPGVAIPAAEQSAPAITGVGNVIGLAAIAFWLFIGVEFIIPVAKDLKDPKKNVLRSMILALIILFAVQSLLGSGMTRYVDLGVLSSSEMPHIIFAENMLGKAGLIWMTFVSLLAVVSTLNTVLPATGRILQGMSDHGMLPKVLGKVNTRNVPWISMAIVAILDCIIIVTGYVNSNGLINMILAGSCFWLASYVLTHINVLVLRRKYPDAPRNKKLIFAGIPQIIGIAGNIYMIWNISSDMESRIMIYKIFGIMFVALALFAFAWCKLVLKTGAFTPVGIEEINKGGVTNE